MPGGRGTLGAMAKNESKYEGFPKFYRKGESNRVANTPADAVNLEHRGFRLVETKAAQKVADQVGGDAGGADKASAVAGKPEAGKSNTAPRSN